MIDFNLLDYNNDNEYEMKVATYLDAVKFNFKKNYFYYIYGWLSYLQHNVRINPVSKHEELFRDGYGCISYMIEDMKKIFSPFDNINLFVAHSANYLLYGHILELVKENNNRLSLDKVITKKKLRQQDDDFKANDMKAVLGYAKDVYKGFKDKIFDHDIPRTLQLDQEALRIAIANKSVLVVYKFLYDVFKYINVYKAGTNTYKLKDKMLLANILDEYKSIYDNIDWSIMERKMHLVPSIIPPSKVLKKFKEYLSEKVTEKYSFLTNDDVVVDLVDEEDHISLITTTPKWRDVLVNEDDEIDISVTNITTNLIRLISDEIGVNGDSYEFKVCFADLPIFAIREPDRFGNNNIVEIFREDFY